MSTGTSIDWPAAAVISFFYVVLATLYIRLYLHDCAGRAWVALVATVLSGSLIAAAAQTTDIDVLLLQALVGIAIHSLLRVHLHLEQRRKIFDKAFGEIDAWAHRRDHG